MKWRANELLWVSQAHDCLLYWASMSISQPSLGSQSSNRWASLGAFQLWWILWRSWTSTNPSYCGVTHGHVNSTVDSERAIRFSCRSQTRAAILVPLLTGFDMWWRKRSGRRGFYGWNGHGIFLVYICTCIYIYIYIYIYMIWYDMIWHDMIWYDLTWHDMI